MIHFLFIFETILFISIILIKMHKIPRLVIVSTFICSYQNDPNLVCYITSTIMFLLLELFFVYFEFFFLSMTVPVYVVYVSEIRIHIRIIFFVPLFNSFVLLFVISEVLRKSAKCNRDCTINKSLKKFNHRFSSLYSISP